MINIKKILEEISLEDLKRQELRTERITVRTFPSVSEWMKDNDISPSRLFNASALVLMEKWKQKK